MSSYIRSSGTQALETLLQWVDSGQIVLPEFQRDLVWTPQMVADLIVSLSNNHPAGSLLALLNSDQFATRPLAGYDGTSSVARPNYLLLDGQQRLTSLYQAFYGRGEHKFFVDLNKLIASDDIEDDGVIVFVRWAAQRGRDRRMREQLETFEGQASALMLPLSAVLGDERDIEGWIRDVTKLVEDRDEADRLLDELTDLRKQWLDPLRKYLFPWIELAQETPPDAVCTIFEQLNRRGVRLGAFDLLVARFYPHGLMLRDLWKETQDNCPIIRDFQIDPYYLLQMVSLLSQLSKNIEDAEESGSDPIAPRSRPKQVLDLNPDMVLKWWELVTEALEEGIKRLGEDCGVVTAKWLPYETMLIPLACTLAYLHSIDGRFPDGTGRSKIDRWFWCSVFGQMYEQGASSQMGTDLLQLVRWLQGGVEPIAVQQFDIARIDLHEIGPQQQALYRGMMALLLSNRPRDFRNGSEIQRSQIEGEVDDHHVFPDAYLGKAISEPRKNSVLNRTLIDRDTNNWIRKKAPSAYLAAIRDGTDNREALGAGKLAEVLESHCLPSSEGGPLWSDEFEAFLEERLVLLTERIRSVTSP